MILRTNYCYNYYFIFLILVACHTERQSISPEYKTIVEAFYASATIESQHFSAVYTSQAGIMIIPYSD